MTYDLARQPAPQTNWAMAILGTLKQTMADIRPHADGIEAGDLIACIDTVMEKMVDDEQRLRESWDLLFGSDITAYGDRTTAVFERWEKEGQGPVMPVFWILAAEHFNLDLQSSHMHAAMLASILAEIPNGLSYHGNEHYRKVMFHMIRLLVTYQQEDLKEYPAFDKDDLFKALIAATIHDIGHEGGDNLREGIYTPGFMEQKAFDLARPYFEAIDPDRDFFGEIETLVFCTDITFFAGDNSPCVRMKKIYRHYFVHDLLPEEDVESMMIGKLRRFEDCPRLAMMAMLLHEADIATSAGLSYEQSQIESIKIMAERGINSAGPKGLLLFLMDQMGGTLYSPAGRKIFLDRMDIIMQQAFAEIEAGVEAFSV